MTDIPFGQWYVSESKPLAAQELVNLYLNIPQTPTVTEVSLLSTPGLTEGTTFGSNEFGRGFHEFNGVAYSVNGDNLYRIDQTFDAFGNPIYTEVDVSGAVSIPGTGRVIMADNGVSGDEICILVSESSTTINAYIYTVSTATLAVITDGDFDGPANGLTFIDGYFLFTKTDTNNFFISNLRDGFSYTATDFTTAEADPDTIQAPFELNGELFIFGTQTIESYQNFGGSGFPFGNIEGGVVKKGTKSPHTIQELNGAMVWVGSGVNEQASIWRSNGGQPQKISTQAIDNQLRTYSTTEIANAFSVKYGQSGAFFVAFTFPGQATFVFDGSTELWHQRESISNDLPVPWRVSHIIDVYSELLVLDSLNNKMGIIDKDVYTEYDEEIRRRFVLPPIDGGGQPFTTDSLELVGETGVGLVDGTDPEVLLSISDNGGRTFNDSESLSFGKIGDYDHRTIWTQLGQAQRERMFKFTVTDPVKWAFTKVEAEFG